ncbi:MAG: hypothetical protein NTX45_17295 [Proteobacteria bacterium]|nr:hypothetical protein [Pseudomonadota bacterium]
MKILFALMAVLAVIFFAPPVLKKFNSQGIHGSTDKRVMQSLKDVRQSMVTEERHTFDVALGLLQAFHAQEGENAFANAVSGKTPTEVVDMAKKEVEAKIAAGEADFKQYTSWEDMLSKKAAEDAPKKPGGQQPPAPLRQSQRTGRPSN